MKKVLVMLVLASGLAACDRDPAPVVVNATVPTDVTVDCTTAPKTDRRCYYDDGTAK